MNIIEHNKNGLVYLTADGFEAAGGVAHGFSTRLGGVSEGIYATLNLGMNRGDAPDRVRENYRRFCAAIGADMGNIVCASQVHGDTVRTVTAADLGIGLDEPEPWQADGLVTDIPGVTLAVYSADCLPILLYDPVRRVVDEYWMDNIDAMQELRQGIGLRAYGQNDPVVAYKKEGYEMFESMIAAIQAETIRRIFLARVQVGATTVKRERVAKVTGESAGSDGTVKKQPVKKGQKVGRNDPCPCGSGKKYKKCCGMHEDE